MNASLPKVSNQSQLTDPQAKSGLDSNQALMSRGGGILQLPIQKMMSLSPK